MGRVLLLCPEPLGHRHPAGVGIRFLEFARALLADGHSVVILSPDGGQVQGCVALQTSPASIRDSSAAADVAVLQGHVANEFFAHAARIPTVVDLYDPFIIENLHYYQERGEEVFRHDHATLTGSLMRGDFFLCASASQRMFYIGAFLATGRFHPRMFDADPTLSQLIAIAPFGVSPPREKTGPPASPADILFGGIYDWYDPILAIESVALVRRRGLDATLTFNHHPNPSITPQSAATQARAFVNDRRYGDFVKFVPWVAYSARGAFYDRFSMALLTFRSSLETDLAMRTRMFDYLWGGLPVITSSAPGTDEIIARYGCGRVVNGVRAEDYAAAVTEAFGESPLREELVDGARAFVEDHQWSGVLRPLLEFCRQPRRAVENHGSPQRAGNRGPLSRLKRKFAGIF